MARIFISYSRVDQPFTEQLSPKLNRTYGNGVWFDKNLYGGEDWWNEILSQIAHCDIFLYLLSNESVQSEYCQAEFAEAQSLNKPIIPILIRARTQIPDDIARFQFVDMSQGITADNITELQAAINRQLARVQASGRKSVPQRSSVGSRAPTRKAGKIKLNEPWAIIIASIIGLIGVVAAAVITLNANKPGDPTPTSRLAVALPSSTPAMMSSSTNTALPNVTPTMPSFTPTVSPLPPTSTPTLTPTATLTPTSTISPTMTEMPTQFPFPPPAKETVLPTSTVLSPTVTSIPAFPCSATITITHGSVLNVVRSDPSPSADLRSPVTAGETVIVTKKIGEFPSVWYQIRDMEKHTLGWIPAEYLVLSASCPQ